MKTTKRVASCEDKRAAEKQENVAGAVVGTLFDYGHLEARPANIEEINNLLKEMTDEDVRKVCRIVKAFTR